MSKVGVHNVILVFDTYVVAESPEAARQAVKDLIADPDPESRLMPDDENARPVLHERSIRDTWKEQSPLVAADVSDEDFARIKGKKTLAIFNLLTESPKKK